MGEHAWTGGSPADAAHPWEHLHLAGIEALVGLQAAFGVHGATARSLAR